VTHRSATRTDFGAEQQSLGAVIGQATLLDAVSPEKDARMLTLFTTPKPFRGHIDVIQRNALASWKNLWPDIQVVVFGEEEGAAEACDELGFQHEPNVETTYTGMKRIDRIFHRAEELAQHPFLCYCNCDIILPSQFARAVERVCRNHRKFLMVGRRWDTPITEVCRPYSEAIEDGLIQFAHASGVQQPGYSVDYFLFSRGLYAEMPPLVIGRIWWDHWLVWHARDAGADVVDVSSEVTAIHQNHDYGYHPEGAKGVWNDEQAVANYNNAGGRWHLYTIDDATSILESNGERRNWRRFTAPYWRYWRPHVIPHWHSFLDATRSVRHKLGIRKHTIA